MARLKLDKSACPGLPRVTPGYLANSRKKIFSRRGKLARIFSKKSSPGVTWLAMPRQMSPLRKKCRGLIHTHFTSILISISYSFLYHTHFYM